MTIRLVLLVSMLMLVLGFGLGTYVTGRRTSTEKAKAETRVEFRDRIVTVTKVVYKNGTIKEETRTEDRQGKEQSRTDHSKTVSSSPQLSLGARYLVTAESAKSNPLLPMTNLEITAGRRLLGNIWLDLGVVPEVSNGHLAIGLRGEW